MTIRRVALALQGGGAHGAFTWGVVDRLLEEDVEIVAVSGVSSGAILGTVLVQGLAEGGVPAARKAMRQLWMKVAHAQALHPWLWGWDFLWGSDMLWQGFEATMRLFSPTLLNPSGHAPLRKLLEGVVRRDLLNAWAAPHLTVAATDVQTGQAVLFDNAAIDVEILVASACLPFVFPPVEIGDRAFWDGAYSRNPPLQPLLWPAPPDEIVLVRALPVRRAQVPRSATEIFNRLNEIACMSALEAELALLPKSVRLVTYADEAELAALPMSSKMLVGEARLTALYEAGRRAEPHVRA
ncbi:MAG TPA: patatin-like phospholipase family protein [Acidisphaera sp.]|nr:patatin-like phospholipase family protein [Acidisphaera sp.]